MTLVLRWSLALCLAAGVLLAPSASACSVAAGESPVQLELPTLHLELAADRAAYRRGERAAVRVSVTHAVAGGPPVRDAVTAVDLTIGSRRVKRAGGSTDAGGRLVLRFVVPRTAPLGKVRAAASAHARLLVSPECEDLVFGTGRAVVEPLMTVRP